MPGQWPCEVGIVGLLWYAGASLDLSHCWGGFVSRKNWGRKDDWLIGIKELLEYLGLKNHWFEGSVFRGLDGFRMVQVDLIKGLSLVCTFISRFEWKFGTQKGFIFWKRWSVSGKNQVMPGLFLTTKQDWIGLTLPSPRPSKGFLIMSLPVPWECFDEQTRLHLQT